MSARTLVARAIHHVEPGAPPAEGWLGATWPRDLALLAWPLLPAVLSGAVRGGLGLPAGPALLVATVLAALLTWPFLPALRVPIRRDWRWAAVHAAPLAVASLAIFELWCGWFDGLVSVGGGDNGNHVLIVRAFGAPGDPGYAGCLGMHALVYWIAHLTGASLFGAMRFVFYANLAFLVATPVAAALAVLPRAPGAFATGAAVAVIATVAAARAFVLPLASYQQADGYLAHLFGFVPLGLLWLVDVLVTVRILRLGVLLVVLVLSRYTYALNLGDAILAVAALGVLESRHTGSWRWVVRVNAAALAATSALVFRALRPLLDHQGAMVHFDRPAALDALATAVAVLGGLFLWDRGWRAEPDRPLGRLVRVPLLLGAAGTAAWVVLGRLPLADDYYLDKYGMLPVLVVAVGLAAALGLLAARVVVQGEDKGARRAAVLALALASAGALWAGVGFARSFAAYRPTYVERRAGRPPWRSMRALADNEAGRRIDAVLAARGARFGGYLTSSWPMSNFMNAVRGATNGDYARYAGPHIDRSAGTCMFWEGPGDGWIEYEGQAVRATLQADPLHACDAYPTPWDPATRRSLCHRCY